MGAPSVGMVIAEATRFVIRRHRSRWLYITIIAAIVLGAAPAILLRLFSFDLFGLIFQGIYLFMAAPAVYYRLSGLQLFS